MVSLAVNFRRSVIIAELWLPKVARPGNLLSNFCMFWKNNPLWQNIQNSVPKVFAASPIDVVVLKCRKICPTEIDEFVRYSRDQKKTKSLAACQTVATAVLRGEDRAQNMPGPTPNILLTMFQLSSKSVYFRQSYSRMHEGCSFGQ